MESSNKLLKYTYGNSETESSVELISKYIRASCIPDDELSRNLGLFLSPSALGRILFMDHLYKYILNVQGVVAEFGCRYGQNVVLFNSLRNIYEPYNRLRKVYGFDTFSGFPSVDKRDGSINEIGDYSVPEKAYQELQEIMEAQNKFSPMVHLEQSELIKGDVIKTVPKFIEDNNHIIFALCYFDLDLYEPTKICLEHVYNRMPKGGVIAFDELNDSDTPGETSAFWDVLSGENLTIRRFNASSRTSYIIKGS